MTWVMADHVAGGSEELSVQKGQQVEVVEGCAPPDWCRVRLCTSGDDSPPEGLVPSAVLKHPPVSAKTSPSRRHPSEPCSATEQGSSDSGSVPAAASSPVNKRKGFGGRKWLPPPLRRISKGEKSGPPDRPPLKKTPSDKKVVVEMGNKPGGEEDAAARLENGEEPEEDVELPPPMKPIQEPLLVNADEAPGDGASKLSLQPLEGAAEIEQIVKERMEQHTEKEKADRGSGGSQTEADALTKRDFVLRELLETERDYVRDLGLVVNGYIALMRDPNCDIPMPDDLQTGKDKIVFGNLEAIYEWHRDRFLVQLEDCQDSPANLGSLFKKVEKKLQIYVLYCKNKPMSEFIVAEYMDTYFEKVQQRLGHRLTLPDLLIKPVQRITKYGLLLKDILKYTERAGPGQEEAVIRLKEALQVMQEIPKSANDMMNVSRLQDFPGNVSSQGKLLLHGTLFCCELGTSQNSKAKELQVFLFEQCIIFSDIIGRKGTRFTEPIYTYKAHLPVNNLKIRPRTAEDEEKWRFVVAANDLHPRAVSSEVLRRTVVPGFVCTASSNELATEWSTKINNLLKAQRVFQDILSNPIASQKIKESNKEISPTEPRLPVSPPADELDPNLLRSQCAIRTPSPTKTKATFLSNMKNVLGRTRSKETEDVPNGCDISDTLTMGSLARVSTEFRATRPDELDVRTGDVVDVVRVGSRGCLVRLCYEDTATIGPEGWLPSHILTSQVGRKQWGFRRRAMLAPRDCGLPRGGGDATGMSKPEAPVLLIPMNDVMVAVGDRAQLTCRIRPASGDMSVTWRLGAADCSVVVRPGGRFAIYSSSDGDCTLAIQGCRAADAGHYTCTVTNSCGSVASSARLTVNGGPTADDEDGGSADWQAEQFRRRYELESELGRGRMSVVWAARDRGTGHVVAVKQVSRNRQSSTVTRAEYNLLATLRHAHLPRALALFAHAPDPGADSIIMELAKEELLECIYRHKEYSEKTVRRAMRELTSAVACLHNHNALHLDIRPENILVDGNGSVKLVDVGEGVRRAALSGAVLPPVCLEFASPEMVLGKSAAAPADMWSLGVFLYVFLSGVSPFLDESLEETTGHILQGNFFFASEHFEGVTSEAKQLVTCLLQTPPQCRESASSVLLHSWFQMEKSESWPTDRLRRFVERRRSSMTSSH